MNSRKYLEKQVWERYYKIYPNFKERYFSVYFH